MNYPIEYHFLIVTSQGIGLFRTKQEAIKAAEWQSQFSCGTVWQGNFDQYGCSHGRDYEIGHFLGPVEEYNE